MEFTLQELIFCKFWCFFKSSQFSWKRLQIDFAKSRTNCDLQKQNICVAKMYTIHIREKKPKDSKTCNCTTKKEMSNMKDKKCTKKENNNRHINVKHTFVTSSISTVHNHDILSE